jgi:hypothetical protein
MPYSVPGNQARIRKINEVANRSTDGFQSMQPGGAKDCCDHRRVCPLAHQAGTQGPHRCLSAIVGAEFIQNIPHVGFDRAHGDE